MNRAFEFEAAAKAALDYLDELAQHADTAARREEARKHARAIRLADQMPIPRAGVEVPTWRKFVLWKDYDQDSDRPQTVTVDVRRVVAVGEFTRRRAYGANNEVASLKMEDGSEIVVTNYDRRAPLIVRERDYEAAP